MSEDATIFTQLINASESRSYNISISYAETPTHRQRHREESDTVNQNVREHIMSLLLSIRRHRQWIVSFVVAALLVSMSARTLAAVLPIEMLSGSMLESLGAENMQ